MKYIFYVNNCIVTFCKCSVKLNKINKLKSIHYFVLLLLLNTFLFYSIIVLLK